MVSVNSEEFAIDLRIPQWSADSSIKINGEPGPKAEAGHYVQVRREWKTGDTVELKLDLRGRMVRLPLEEGADPSAYPHIAIERGPVVLARDIRLENANIDNHIPLAGRSGTFVDIKRVTAPKDIWMAFEVSLSAFGEDRNHIMMCDYSSAGNTWSRATSAFRTWLPTQPGMVSKKEKATLETTTPAEKPEKKKNEKTGAKKKNEKVNRKKEKKQ